MGLTHRIGVFLGAALLAGSALAAGVALKPDHPERYTVKKGDTLWDIAGRFLEKPWRWPEIWKVNPQIKNPDLIYPGDELVLTYVGGNPRVQVYRGHPTVKLSPHVREEPLATAIPTIPIDAISQFLKRPLLVDKARMEAAPYIVSVGKEALMAHPGGKFYARGIENANDTRYSIYRLGQKYVDPESGDVLGYEGIHVGDAVLETPGDPATLRLTSLKREVLAGDRLLPVREQEVQRNFMPRPPSKPVKGEIIAVVEGVTQIGQHQIVVLNRGRADGIDTGSVMAVYQRGETIDDPLAKNPDSERNWWPSADTSHIELDPKKQGGLEGLSNAANDLVFDIEEHLGHLAREFNLAEKRQRRVRLPDERSGTVMVVRPFERLSYALVMSASRAMHVHDTVRNP